MADSNVARFREYRQHEVDSAFIYRALAELEESEPLAEVYRRLAATEERHEGVWRSRLRAAGEQPAELAPTRRARVLVWLARRLGPEYVLPTLSEQEARDSHAYGDYEQLGEPGMSGDERSRARLLRTTDESQGPLGIISAGGSVADGWRGVADRLLWVRLVAAGEGAAGCGRYLRRRAGPRPSSTAVGGVRLPLGASR